MKKSYIQPNVRSLGIRTDGVLLSASDSQPTSIIDDETADGDESLSRRGSFSLWDDDE